jgi:hypothetical protein
MLPARAPAPQAPLPGRMPGGADIAAGPLARPAGRARRATAGGGIRLAGSARSGTVDGVRNRRAR